jgi:hypothetical protein
MILRHTFPKSLRHHHRWSRLLGRASRIRSSLISRSWRAWCGQERRARALGHPVQPLINAVRKRSETLLGNRNLIGVLPTGRHVPTASAPLPGACQVFFSATSNFIVVSTAGSVCLDGDLSMTGLGRGPGELPLTGRASRVRLSPLRGARQHGRFAAGLGPAIPSHCAGRGSMAASRPASGRRYLPTARGEATWPLRGRPRAGDAFPLRGARQHGRFADARGLRFVVLAWRG